MAMIRAVRNDGKPYSQAEGSVKTILNMIASLPESRTRQIVISKTKFDKFAKESKLGIVFLNTIKIFDCFSQRKLTGTIKRAIGLGYESNFELYYVDVYGLDHYILYKAIINGKEVYVIPKTINSSEGLMELSL